MHVRLYMYMYDWVKSYDLIGMRKLLAQAFCPKSPDPFPSSRVGSGDKTTLANIRWVLLCEFYRTSRTITYMYVGGQTAKILYDGYKLVDAGFDVIRSIFKVGRFAGTGAGAARVAWTGINTITGGLSIAGVIFDVVALPFDLFVLIKGSYDIHKYKSGKGSNCNKANRVGEIIKKLEEHKQQMLQIRNMFTEESTDI